MVALPDFRVEVAFDSGVRTPAASRNWTDVSTYVELHDTIAITRGRGDEFSTASPSSLSLTLDNTDGRFTPGKATSPYYPNVKLGRPIRVLAQADTTVVGNFLEVNQATFEGSASVPDWWTAGGTVPPALTRSTLHPHASSWGMQIAWGTGGTLPLAQTTVTGLTIGRTYTASAYGYVPTGDPSILLVVPGTFGSNMTTKNAVTRFSVTFTATASTQLLQVWPATAPVSSDLAFIDDVQVWEGATQVAMVTTPAADVISTRFTGFVDEWPVEWRQGVDANAHAQITATSRQARLGEGAELRSIIETEIMADNPVAYYPLGEAEGATHSTELTGSDTIGMYSYYSGTSASDITWGTANGPTTDSLPALQLYPTRPDDQPVMLAANFRHPGMTAVTVECFANLPRRNVNDTISVIGLFENLRGKESRFLQVDGASVDVGSVTNTNFGGDYFELIGGSFSNVGNTVYPYTDANDIFAIWDSIFTGATHHFAVTFVPGATPVLKMYIDGKLFQTKTGLDVGPGPLLTTMPNWSYLVIGNYTTDSGNLPMVVSHAAVFDVDLPAARIAAHANAGLTGFTDEFAGARIVRYADYAGIDATEISADTGSAAVAHIDTTGQTVDNLLRIIETTEGGVLYDGRDGSLIFRDRGHRYQATSAFTLNAATQQLEADGLRPLLDRSTLVNSVTAKSSDGTVEQRYEDTSAADDYGLRRVDVEVATTDADQVYQAAAWRVNRYKEPQPRIGELAPIDALMLDSTTRDAVIAADVSTRFTVSNLPAQAPATTSDFFVEGITEVMAEQSWRFQFNASPASIYDGLWVLDSATNSQLGTTTVLAY